MYNDIYIGNNRMQADWQEAGQLATSLVQKKGNPLETSLAID